MFNSDSLFLYVSDIFKGVITGTISLVLSILILTFLYYCYKIMQRWYKCAVITRTGHDQKEVSEYIDKRLKKASKLQLFILGQTGMLFEKTDIIFFSFCIIIFLVLNFLITTLETPTFLQGFMVVVSPVLMVLGFIYFAIMIIGSIYSLITKARIVPLIASLILFFIYLHNCIL